MAFRNVLHTSTLLKSPKHFKPNYPENLSVASEENAQYLIGLSQQLHDALVHKPSCFFVFMFHCVKAVYKSLHLSLFSLHLKKLLSPSTYSQVKKRVWVLARITWQFIPGGSREGGVNETFKLRK